MYIEIKDAVKKYGEGENEIFAMDGVNLDISEHEICVILGPSGSGKSTLLNMLGGIDTLTSGKIVVNGKEISGMSKKELTSYRRSDIGFIFQSYNLIQDLTVKENIQTVADISREPLDIDELLESLSLSKYKNHFPSELSGGQQQRTAIARALVKNPAILLCDEPTGALDYVTGKSILKLLQTLSREHGVTVVIITHNSAIKPIADRTISVKSGKIKAVELNDKPVDIDEIEW